MADPLMGWIFTGIGVFGQAGALALAQRPIRLLRAGGKAQGTIVDNEERMISSSRGPSRLYYFPQIAFTTAKGERVSFKSNGGGKVALPKGTVVPLIYDPEQPHEAQMAGFLSLWLFPLALCLFSLPFLIAGLFVVV